ncbi:MAG: quinoprotein glucose dehydrogenase [Acidobacteria bacterium]|nr:MAG: quinoprotein glucose dehydrogenase [Acidobacteriota bacterium]
MKPLVRRCGFLAVPVICLLVLATPPIAGQSGTAKGEWPSYGADVANTRYSPLDQINAENFSKLEVAWRFKTESLGPRPEYQFESTPLMVRGVVYSTAGTRRAVVALDALTGELIWMHSEREGERGEAAPRQLSGRGLAYWTDGREERILYVTPGYRLVALDAKTGAPVPGFGRSGIVDLKLEDDQVMDLVTGEIGLHATPVVAGNTVIIGAAHLSGGVPRGKTNQKGYVRGYDVKSGKRLWIFHTIPRPGEFGNDTWLNDSWSYTGNTGVWGQISVDEQLGMVYLPVEAPTGDYYGGHRPGANLFGESIVAVDLKNGQRKWHYQLVHHGIWDHDIPCAPILVDIVVNGRPIKALAQPTKQAFLYVFDRVTGKPIWPIEERPVEKGDVPGEWYSPTQPFPLDARGNVFQYDRNGFVRDDLIDFTPELRAEGEKVIARYKIGPIFTPPVVSRAEGPLGTLQLAINGGGTVWAGGSFDPETHIFYVYSRRQPGALGLVKPDPAKNDMNYVQGSALTGSRAAVPMGAAPGRASVTVAPPAPGAGQTPGTTQTPAPAPSAGNVPAAGRGAAGGGGGGEGGGGGGLLVQGLPIVKPPYGSISAISLDKGEILWQIPHGDTPDAVRNHPALKGVTIPRTGQAGIIGTLVTKTLVIAGEAQLTTAAGHPRGALLRAYDKATGKDAGTVFMPAQQTGSPMTYMVNGKQYIVLAIGGGGYPGELLAFRLPG